MISPKVKVKKSMSKVISHTIKEISKKAKNKDKESINGIKNNIILDSLKITKWMALDNTSASTINTKESFVMVKNKEKARCTILIKIGHMKVSSKTI